MRNSKIVLLSMLSLSLSACSTDYDCNSDDVHSTLMELIAGNTKSTENAVEGMFGVGGSAAAAKAFANATFAAVVTLDKNEDTGYFECKADVSVELPDGNVATHEVNYYVTQVESDDADFEVSAEQSDINSLRWAVNGRFNQNAQQQAKEQAHDDLVAGFKTNPPTAVTDADAAATIKQALQEMPGGFDETQFTLVAQDLNADGYKEYIALWRDPTATTSRVWKVKQFWQQAKTPGEQATLEYSYEDYYAYYGDHPINHYELAGNVLTVSDGTGWSEAREMSSRNIGPF